MSAATTAAPRRAALLAAAATALLATMALVLALGTTQAEAKAPILSFGAGTTSNQAGGHPDVRFDFTVGNRRTQENPSDCYCENPKTFRVSLPTGVIGDPHAAPTCSAAEFAQFKCPSETQVGLQAILLSNTLENGGQYALAPVFNLNPSPNQAGLIGFNQPLIPAPIFTILSSRTGSDYGLDATVPGVTQFVPVYGLAQVLWGVPADPSHDGVRFPRGTVGFFCAGLRDPLPFIFGNPSTIPDFCGTIKPTPSNAAPKALISNPTRCNVLITAGLEVLSYDTETDSAEAFWPPTVGCDQLGFNPSLSGQPTTRQTDAASGLDVNLKVPQSESPSSPATSEIRAVRVTMPEGFSINPNAADGKLTCSNAQASIGSDEEARCPENAKVGSLVLDTPALPTPLPGYIYLGDPLPGDRYRLIITADGYAVHVKLPGSVSADPATGRVVVRFEDLPQTTFSEFDMHFFGSERGLLATPTRCGTYQVDTEFVPWADELPNQTSTQYFTLDSGPGGAPCPGPTRPFAPALNAGVMDNNAGVHTEFALDLTRADGNQLLDRLDVDLPPGFSARLKGVPYCPEAAIAAARQRAGRTEMASPSCPAASRIGAITSGVGAGNHPLYVSGTAYLAGPYRGAPLSLLAVVPAVSGPYDLGTVVVRSALEVDPVSAEVTARSDQLPRILEGIPLRQRSLLVRLDRPRFALNPTNCDPFSIVASVFGDEGGLAHPSNDFQVANCASLPFGPKLALKLRGGLARRGHPALRAVLTAPEGSSNIGRTVVQMPANELLDNDHIGTICTRPQFAVDACPAGSRYGQAEAFSPLLDAPLRGPVYLRSSSNELPDLVADLEGQIDIELAGKIDSPRGRGLRASFNQVPDVPVSRFVLSMEGGKKGLLQNSRSLCRGEHRAKVTMVSQDGARIVRRSRLDAACGGKGRTNRHERGGHR